MSSGQEYRYRGARALVRLHATHLRDCIAVWKKAKAAQVSLPVTDDPSYESLDTLLRHILRAARGYMVWMCQMLELPDPGIDATPEADVLPAQVDQYLEHVLERWDGPLVDVEPGRFDQPEFKSRWGVLYCIDAMLEHAVMHPIRHQFQMEEWLRDQ